VSRSPVSSSSHFGILARIAVATERCKLQLRRCQGLERSCTVWRHTTGSKPSIDITQRAFHCNIRRTPLAIVYVVEVDITLARAVVLFSVCSCFIHLLYYLTCVLLSMLHASDACAATSDPEVTWRFYAMAK
jgi:hypothetical protein